MILVCPILDRGNLSKAEVKKAFNLVKNPDLRSFLNLFTSYV